MERKVEGVIVRHVNFLDAGLRRREPWALCRVPPFTFIPGFFCTPGVARAEERTGGALLLSTMVCWLLAVETFVVSAVTYPSDYMFA